MRAFFLIPFFIFIFSACTEEVKNDAKTEEKKDTLLYLNHADTAKYVGINTCKLCHQKIYNTFIETGMGKSFDHATKQKSAGDYKHSSIYDKISDLHYHAYWKDSSLRFQE